MENTKTEGCTIGNHKNLELRQDNIPGFICKDCPLSKTERSCICIRSGERKEHLPDCRPIKTEWEKEFDEYYPELLSSAGNETSNVKDFISSTIKAREREILSDLLKLTEIGGEGYTIHPDKIERYFEEYSKGL